MLGIEYRFKDMVYKSWRLGDGAPPGTARATGSAAGNRDQSISRSLLFLR